MLYDYNLALGQGGAQAVEDAITLGIFLPLGVSRDQIPRRLELYQMARKEQAEFVQKYSLERLLAHDSRFEGSKSI